MATEIVMPKLGLTMTEGLINNWLVKEGDTIEIDVDNKQLNLLVPDEEIEARLKQWKRPEPKFKKGWLGLYCKLAASGSEGGVMKFDHL